MSCSGTLWSPRTEAETRRWTGRQMSRERRTVAAWDGHGILGNL